MLDGIVLVSSITDTVWKIHDPPWWRLDRRIGLRIKHWIVHWSKLGYRIPIWAQVGKIRIALVDYDIVRDTKTTVVWVPDVDTTSDRSS